MQVLNATVSQIHMANIMKHLKRISTKTRPFLFKAIPSMSKYENQPIISGHMLTTEWQRAGFPGQLKLAEDMGAGERSVRTYLKELEAAGILEIKQRGLGKTNLYRLHLTIKKLTARRRN